MIVWLPSANISAAVATYISDLFSLNQISVKGRYNATTKTYPAFNIKLDLVNGDVKYPDLPLGITNINTNMVVNSPSSNLDEMLIDISKFSKM